MGSRPTDSITNILATCWIEQIRSKTSVCRICGFVSKGYFTLRELFKDLVSQVLIYLVGFLCSSALGLLVFVLLYKLHVYWGFPEPSINGLTFVVFVGMLIFKHVVERNLEELGLEIKDVLPKLLLKLLWSVSALALVVNIDVVINFIMEVNKGFYHIIGIP